LDNATYPSRQETYHEILESEKPDIGRRVHEGEHNRYSAAQEYKISEKICKEMFDHRAYSLIKGFLNMTSKIFPY
jgi:metal-dependent HD superfamily phosphatase/phosphodiesterase